MVEQTQEYGSRHLISSQEWKKEPQLACDMVLVPSYVFYWVSQRPLLDWVGRFACSCSEFTSCRTLQPHFSFPSIRSIILYDLF